MPRPFKYFWFSGTQAFPTFNPNATLGLSALSLVEHTERWKNMNFLGCIYGERNDNKIFFCIMIIFIEVKNIKCHW